MFARVARRLKHEASSLTDRIVRQSLPGQAATMQHLGHLFPYEDQANSYTLPAYPGSDPIPPLPLWASYCTTPESYLQSGRDDAATMTQILAASGWTIADSGRILDLGVAGGRMIRHLKDLTPRVELWGVDIWAAAILWCQEHLSFANFATTTVNPHLPFEDRSFGLIYAGSLWTHLDDLADAWFLECHRLLRPGGRLYFSINDRSAVKVFQGGGKDRARYLERIRPDNWAHWIRLLDGHEGYQRFAKGEAQMVTMGRSTASHVMWDADYLLKKLTYGWKCCSVTPEGYGHQTVILLERR